MGEYLGEIKEPRRTAYGNFRHTLIDIIVIGLTATRWGSDEFEEMEEFSRLDPVQLHKSLDNWLVDSAERQKSKGGSGTACYAGYKRRCGDDGRHVVSDSHREEKMLPRQS
ncbi:MAG: hypothetical protein LBT14_08730 [Treponema sp.]|jgi:hypothetical protein|nr:hypothetical protein [Treponema sp.]